MRPHPTLTDIARSRLDVISFFALAFLLMALPVKWAWNYLRRDFTRLPRITYFRSLCLVTLWGLLFVIVLAMISGARELMTPGAWEKKPTGGYRLADAPAGAAGAEPSADTEAKRRYRLERLYKGIEEYRSAHAGKYPPHDFVPEIPEAVWESPHPSRQRYVYARQPQGGASPRPDSLLASEPSCYGTQRLILLASGKIESVPDYVAFDLLRRGIEP
ncbi:hypothetical protein [Humisphaera borealis]|uniref:Uncharacterized protein n=1 Tax=Humisphaera borealis TaxID=2807512 RepID=A0A7M2WZ05_9BACT|nr:hypothetical protein [Humisphaera borealis]QOV90081.1 hypothetical protein IPV69_01535 [Humisphaera borealis]